jgi:hypothetical protein
MSEIFIHIGFPKCASSFLQENLFSVSEGINYIGKNTSGFFDRFIDDEYDISLLKGMVPENDLPTVISIEGLVGIAGMGLKKQREVFAKRLYRLFPSAKILIIVRRQEKVLESLFSEWMVHGHTGRYDVNTLFEKIYREEVDFSLEYFNYKELFSLYCDLFGHKQIKVYLFEEFVQNKDYFIDRIYEDIGIDGMVLRNFSPSRRKLGPVSYFVVRHLNKLRRGIYNSDGLFGYESYFNVFVMKFISLIEKFYYSIFKNKRHVFLSEKNIAEIRQYYMSTNIDFAKDIGRDLKPYGY